MIIRADLHLHSKYSRATSESMGLDYISLGAKTKGLNLVGTGDFTHPKWFGELKGKLKEAGDGIYTYGGVNWMLTCEVSLIYFQDGKSRRVHLLLHAPSLEVVEQINDVLSRYGDLSSDGRPTFTNLASPELVELMNSIDDSIFVIPSHAWTTWYGVFGANTGFDSLEDCFKDKTHKIFAIETGLSCYDEMTEVLTESGWKRFPEVRKSDRICTLNLKTGKIEFQKPIKMYKYDYRGRMYRLKTGGVDLLVTPNHRLLVGNCSPRKPPHFFLREAEFLFNRSKRFKKDGVWTGKELKYFMIPKVGARHGSQGPSGSRIMYGKKIPMRSWLKFFGSWIGGGETDEGGDSDFVILHTGSRSLRSEMVKLLKRFGYDVCYERGAVRVRDYQLSHYLRQFGGLSDRFIPARIKSLSRDLLQVFLRYYIRGSSFRGRRRGGLLVSASTTSVRLRDDLQEIGLKLGMSTYCRLCSRKTARLRAEGQKLDFWKVYFTRKRVHTFQPSMAKKHKDVEAWEDYSGQVFCVSVPNQVIYVRRNYVPVWCGNSDPPMNWRVSALDKVTLVSNSDSHSPTSFRLGREFNVFDLEGFSYRDIFKAIKDRDRKRFLYTVEVPPEYGKYHYSGHRDCGISLHPRDAMRINNICPVCKRKLTVGVLQRVEELADRPEGYVPQDAIPYKAALPLYEVISYLRGSGTLYSRRVEEEETRYIKKAGDEISILLDIQEPLLSQIVGHEVASIITRLRNGAMKFEPGYDGVYGKPLLKQSTQRNLTLD